VKSRIFGVLAIGVCLLTLPASASTGDEPLIDDVAPFKAALLQKYDDKQFAELEKIERRSCGRPRRASRAVTGSCITSTKS